MRLGSASALFHCRTRRSLSHLGSSSCARSRIITPDQTIPLRLDLTQSYWVLWLSFSQLPFQWIEGSLTTIYLQVVFFLFCFLKSFRLMAANTWNTQLLIADLFAIKIHNFHIFIGHLALGYEAVEEAKVLKYYLHMYHVTFQWTQKYVWVCQVQRYRQECWLCSVIPPFLIALNAATCLFPLPPFYVSPPPSI